MAINSIQFVGFSLAVLFLYFIMPKKIKWVVLLLASYFFYFFSSSKLIIFLLITTLSIYLSTLLMENKDKKKKKLILIVTVLLNIGILFTLKYFNFFLGIFNIKGLFKIALPLGISYYTLQALSYVIDIYRGKYSPEKNFFKVSLFLSYFPIITEGPISRFDKLGKQLFEGHNINFDNLKYGFTLILFGYFKKMVIADRAALFVNEVFGQPYSGITIFMAIGLYTLQIYAEFSACIDIVRGLSKMMGIDLEENFKRPFFSKDVQEFWRRWHITLGAWLRDYIFYPISLSKINMKLNKSVRSKLKNNLGKVIIAAFPLFFVWVTNGIWHGVGWKYLIYGMYYYIIMILGMLFKPVFDFIISKLKINVKSKLYNLFRILRTIFLVMIGMLIFRTDNITEAFNMFVRMFSFNNNGILNNGLCLIDYIILSVFLIIMIIKGILEEKGINVYEKIDKSNIVVQDALLIITVLLLIVFGIYGPGYNASDFIYGGF